MAPPPSPPGSAPSSPPFLPALLWNNMGVQGGMALAPAVQRLTGLKNLYLK